MKKYKVNVNGNVYEITLELMEGDAPVAPAKAAPVSAPSAPSASAKSTSGGESVVAPIERFGTFIIRLSLTSSWGLLITCK